MYIPEFICGMAFIIIVEFALAIVISLFFGSNKENKKEGDNEETNYTDKESKQQDS